MIEGAFRHTQLLDPGLIFMKLEMT